VSAPSTVVDVLEKPLDMGAPLVIRAHDRDFAGSISTGSSVVRGIPGAGEGGWASASVEDGDGQVEVNCAEEEAVSDEDKGLCLGG